MQRWWWGGGGYWPEMCNNKVPHPGRVPNGLNTFPFLGEVHHHHEEHEPLCSMRGASFKEVAPPPTLQVGEETAGALVSNQVSHVGGRLQEETGSV